MSYKDTLANINEHWSNSMTANKQTFKSQVNSHPSLLYIYNIAS